MKEYHRINYKRMYIDKEIFIDIKKLGIKLDDINNTYKELVVNGHPKPTYNNACNILIFQKRGKK